jgi:hypothetical protein
MPRHPARSAAALVGEGEGVGFVPVEVEMAGIGRDHRHKGFLIGILKTKLQPEAVGEREAVVGDIVAGVDSIGLLGHCPVNDVSPVRCHIEPHIVRTRFGPAF